MENTIDNAKLKLSPEILLYLDEIIDGKALINKAYFFKTVSQDAELSRDEQEAVARALAFAVFTNSKSGHTPISTKQSFANFCDERYYRDLKNIRQNFIIYGTISIITGGYGLPITTIKAYQALHTAEVEWKRCLKANQFDSSDKYPTP